MMKFLYQYDEVAPRVEITLDNPDVDLTQALEAFNSFILACGYIPGGVIDVTDENCGCSVAEKQKEEVQ